MGWQRCCLLAVLIFIATRAAQAGVLPVGTATLTVDGASFPVPVLPDPQGGGKVNWMIDNVVVDVPGAFRAMISGYADSDPAVNYGLAISDFGAPSSFSFTFTSPIVPTGPPTFVRAQVAGGLNDVGGGGVTITPTLGDLDGDGIAEVQTASLGAPLTNAKVDVGPAKTGVAVGAGPGNEYRPGGAGSAYSAGLIAGPAGGPWTSLSVTAAFTLTGGGDSVALTGFASAVVPEPSTVLLALACAALSVFVLRRRSKLS